MSPALPLLCLLCMDPMVRTAVKTLTLNVYAIPLPAVQRFVASRPAAAYFSELATYIAEQCQVRGQEVLGEASFLPRGAGRLLRSRWQSCCVGMWTGQVEAQVATSPPFE